MEDMDKNFESIRNRMQSYEEKPNEQMWENISQKVAKPRVSYLTGAVITSSVLLAGFIGILLFTPSKSESSIATTKANSISAQSQEKQIDAKVENIALQNVENETKIQQIETKKEFTETKIQQNETKTEISSTQQIKSIEAKSVETKNQNTTAKAQKTTTASESTTLKTQSIMPKAEIKASKPNVEQVVENNIESKNSPNTVTRDTVRMKLFVPNAFTPSETTNNIFKPAFAEVLDYRMDIYNRQGVLMFSTTDISEGWNGVTKNGNAPQGGYYYIIRFKDLEGKQHNQKGSLILLR